MDDRRPLCLGPIEVAVGLAHDHVRIGAHMAVPLSTPRCGSLGAARARTAERTSCSGERERRVCRQQVRRRVGSRPTPSGRRRLQENEGRPRARILAGGLSPTVCEHPVVRSLLCVELAFD
jgi:hypothetical protein